MLLTMALQAPQQANACSCYPWPPPVCASLNNADVIVVATAQSVEPTGEGLFDDIKYDVEVTNVYKEDEPVTQNLDVSALPSLLHVCFVSQPFPFLGP